MLKTRFTEFTNIPWKYLAGAILTVYGKWGDSQRPHRVRRMFLRLGIRHSHPFPLVSLPGLRSVLSKLHLSLIEQPGAGGEGKAEGRGRMRAGYLSVEVKTGLELESGD